MLKSLLEFYRLLAPVQQRNLKRLQILVFAMAVSEVVGVASIAPFMALVGNPHQLQGEGTLAKIYRASGLATPEQFISIAGVGALMLLGSAAALSMFTLWRLTVYGAVVGAEVGNRLFAHYMSRPWTFHSTTNSSELINNVAQESQRLTDGVIASVLQLNARIALALLMSLGIFLLDPFVAIAGLALFSASYFLLYRMIQARVHEHGLNISRQQSLRLRLMSEGFAGIKDMILLGHSDVLERRFESASLSTARSRAASSVLGQLPRYGVEFVALGSVILLVLYLVNSRRGDLGSILPVLSIYALAGMKLLPAFQQIFYSTTQVRGHLPVLNILRKDLQDSLRAERLTRSRAVAGRLVPHASIELDCVTFRYPGLTRPALREMRLSVPAKKVIGLVGESGSGKSTVIDVLAGLVVPQEGRVLVDGSPVDAANMRAWQNALGVVSQSIFLSDASIRENIAFGLPPEDISDEKVWRAIEMAHLQELIKSLPDGLDTRVGERGVQLSGGQRQRIAIARALYDDADVLMLDEATSALDGISEKMIMDAIHELDGRKTIILVAHRLATVRKCDWIYMVGQGEVVDQGTYDDLIARNKVFKRMAEHS